MNLSPLLAACGTAAAPAGGERGVCAATEECGEGLECWSERCVRPPPADCRAVGERLATLSLGNYASREEREVVVTKWERACTGERLSLREGRCIVEAVGEDELAACPRPLVPELVGDPKGCAQLGEKAAQLMKDAEGRMRPIVNVLDDVPDVVKELCVDGRWAPEAKQCFRSAAGFADAQVCLAKLDGADRRAMERRLTMLVKKGMARGKPPEPDPWK